MFRILSFDAGVARRAILIGVTIVLASHWCAAGDATGLKTVVVEDIGRAATGTGVDGTESQLPESQPQSDPDPIARELRLQRAIADSLNGRHEQALASLAAPDPDDTPTIYASAMWLLKVGEVAEGIRMLESIASAPDAPPETAKYLAVGYLHLDRPWACEQAVDDYLSRHPTDAYAHYVRGLAILRQDQPERAVDPLRQAGYDDGEVTRIQQVVMQVPIDVAQRRSTIGTARPTRDSRPPSDSRPYNFTLLMAGEYDSNVALQPRFSGLGSDAIDHEDYRFSVASFLDVPLLSRELYNFGFVGSTYSTFQFESNDFDIQDYMGGGYANAVLTDDLIGSMHYEFHHTLVEKTRFASEHRVTPSLTWLGSRGHTTLFYEFNPIDAEAPALIPAQVQSSDIHRIGLTQAVYTWGGDGRLYAGYQYAEALAEGSDFDRTSHMVTGRIEQPLKRRWITDFDARFVWDDYEHPNSLDFFDRPRDDDRLELRAGLQKNFSAPVSLRFDYTYINNDSNTENLFGVRFYDYDRHIFSTQLIFSL